MSKIFGYNVSGLFNNVLITSFVLDENDLERFGLDARDKNALYKAVEYARHTEESTVFHDVHIAVEVIKHEVFVPRYVILRGPSGNRFYTTYTAEERWAIIQCQGKDIYDILGFANTVQEVQFLLYGQRIPSFATMRILAPHSDSETHRTHCCKQHGCKYGDLYCPVATGSIEQAYPCETCSEEKHESV